MHFTRLNDLALAALAGIGVGYVTFDLAYGAMAGVPRLAGVLLLVLAIAEVAFAVWIRDRVRAGRLIQALLVSRAVILAKASSLFGMLMLGAWLGALVFLAMRAGYLVAAREDLPSAIIGALCAAALVAAALWLEHSCRTPEQAERDRLGGSDERP
ncbi:MAG: DUF3180 family protein [Actinophytocola sp.]|nr:DUF3180 family protein [Actinophytocola sp.]